MHAYICECGNRNCSERITLDHDRWLRLAREGTVVCEEHAEGKRVKARALAGATWAVAVGKPLGL